MRERKQRKTYLDDWALNDEEEIEGSRAFSLQDKLESPRFATNSLVKEMHGTELTLAYIQRYGFNTPLLFRETTGLGLRVPSPDFTVNDVRMCVGSRRVLDVMDVNTQKNFEMTMKEWQSYYESPHKDRLLNVISLEFSHTKLESYIQTPTIVRQVDWVDVVWPRHLKEAQTEATNRLDDMMYPKVQKYCLMSVKGCYTDFHVDFGGTSVWYHILRGTKVFWLIPPTNLNLKLYEQWVLSGKQTDVFFGDTVEKCSRVVLHQGNTFFIPTGWIHAVYTPRDSLVFGGNFLHSYGIEKQLQIAQVEDATKVPQKFRYPYFTEMLWYVLERYVHSLLNRSHLVGSPDTDIKPDIDGLHVHLTKQELHGLKEIVMYLHGLPYNRKNVPELIKDPIALITDVRTLVGLHRNDKWELAITGLPILKPPDDRNSPRIPLQRNYVNRTTTSTIQTPSPVKKETPSTVSTTNTSSNQNNNGGPRRRRTRCKKCEACQRNDCGECSFCLDMVKFGGPGRAKQTCNMRQCLQPMLPVTAACKHCGLDGWGQTPVVPLQKGTPGARNDEPSSLMECSVCYEIAHTACVQRLCPGISGVVNEDMPNSWECPPCCKAGKNTDYKPRHFRARQKSSDIRRMSVSSDASMLVEMESDGESVSVLNNSTVTPIVAPAPPPPPNDQKPPPPINNTPISSPPVKRRRSEEVVQQEMPAKQAARAQLAHQLVANSTKNLRKPMYVVRPAPIHHNNSNNNGHLILDRRVLIPVFKYLTPAQLFTCSLVCKTWSKLTIEPELWKKMDFEGPIRPTAAMLRGIARRQPQKLILNWTQTVKRQLAWLLSHLPGLRELHLQGINVQTALALRTCLCPPLHVLNLSHVSGLNDGALRDILSPPSDSRPGLTDSSSKLKQLKKLDLSGTDISDVALRYVAQYLPQVSELILSSCARVSDAGVAQLSSINTLTNLDLSCCKLITEVSLDHLTKCANLTRLDLRQIPQVTTQAVIKFAAKSPHNLTVHDVKLVDKRQNINKLLSNSTTSSIVNSKP
ncbi:jmjC domain-containing histone demethylation protein 1-like isoform X2 [Chrysoperla carnea]|uniref:jmjC domain-containing histone demethylation protein 1-like isoform X2 n=1 Tax=Chrysoperla carnea TaxID=189513 RepID=UPI001D0797EE|nr:jmjC domain-containing histone demethylation protein 1-like isoform X2 [Chrysoperla carnea]